MPRKLPAPPGYKIEGVHGRSNGPHMLVGSGITLGLAIIAIVLRMIVRCFIVSSVGGEDYFAVAALLLSVGRTIMLILMTKNHQFGQHIWDILIPNFGFVYTWAKGATIVYLGAITCVKVSILLLYIRLFGINRPFRFSCYALMALVPGYCTAMILANVFQCRPVKAGWSFFTPGHCASLQEITVATGALNIISDVAIVIAPIPLVLKLQLKPAKKIGVLVILATGFLVVAVAIVREVEVVRAPSSYDATWTDATRTLWLSVELNVGILCSCLPILPPLSRKLPGRNYFKDQYNSAISLIRGSRRKSRGSRSTTHDVQLGPRERDYIELEEAGVGTKSDVRMVRELEPISQAAI